MPIYALAKGPYIQAERPRGLAWYSMLNGQDMAWDIHMDMPLEKPTYSFRDSLQKGQGMLENIYWAKAKLSPGREGQDIHMDIICKKAKIKP